MKTSRRSFLQTAAVVGSGVIAGESLLRNYGAGKTPGSAGPRVISSGNGLAAATKAMELLHQGSSTLDAVIAGVNIVEDDPNDTSVGYGGLPNEEGEVELDAAVMHGPNHLAGAVASLRNIKNPSRVARLVMERTDHVLLVGEGALRFAKAHGFQEENLLTDAAREQWLRWKETNSNQDDWLPEHSDSDRDIGELFRPFVRHHGTIHCSALDAKGSMSCVTTTSGLAYKIPGRVGDSPIIGAGLYVDNEIGSAGSTGRGEANLVNCSCVMIVEYMRQGKSPEEACLEACRRIVGHNIVKRLSDEHGRPNFNVVFYALSKRGEYGSAAIYDTAKYTVADGTGARQLPTAYLYKK